MPAPESTPVPPHPKAAPHHSPQNHSRASTAHSSPGAATAAGSVGATGRGARNGTLSSHARYLSNPRPDYPEEARQKHQEGVVMVSVEVGTDGSGSDVTLARSSGFPLLDAAALQAVRRWRLSRHRWPGYRCQAGWRYRSDFLWHDDRVNSTLVSGNGADFPGAPLATPRHRLRQRIARGRRGRASARPQDRQM